MNPEFPALVYHDPAFAASGPSGRIDADVCVYGGTAGGVVAAIQAARFGRSVILLEPASAPGGMTASGLGFTDIGNKAAIGGLAREFYRRIGAAYGAPEAWTFVPSVAERVFREWLAEHDNIRVYYRQFLADLTLADGRIVALKTESGLEVRASVFIDATYEGDLLARAGVSHIIGREDNATHGETLNGAQLHSTHQFESDISAYRIAGDPSSGLLPGLETEQPVIGRGDHRVQAYCFRMCMTDDAANRIPFPKPAAYDRSHYELLARVLATGWNEVFMKFDRLRVRTKTDTNNHGAVSSDFIGQSNDWAAAGHAERERLFQAHVTYQQGFHWFMANDASVPAPIREAYARWGLCRDEFTATGGWPHQLYVREARRMVSDYVMTEHECRGARAPEDAVALAAYTMDSHNCRRFVDTKGHVRNEGDVQEHSGPPYPISYRSIVPRRGECKNLLVPVCLSASHIAYGSIRMEPVFMVLGQSAATAAELALRAGASTAMQDVPYDELRAALLKGGQELAWDPAVPAEITSGNFSEA